MVGSGQFGLLLLVVGVLAAAAATFLSRTGNLDALATAEWAVGAGVGVPAVILFALIRPVRWRALRSQRNEARAEVRRLAAALARRPVTPEHREELRAMLRSSLTAVQADREYDYEDEPDRRSFRREMLQAHFPEAVDELDRWNAAVIPTLRAPKELKDRFVRECRDRGLYAPRYDELVLAEGLTRMTVENAVGGRLHERVYSGALRFGGTVGPTGGITIWGMDESAIDTSDIPTQRDPSKDWEKIRSRLDELQAPIIRLADDARSWPEAAAVASAHEALKGYRRAHIRDVIQAEVVRAEVVVAADCPSCGDRHN